MKKSLIAWLVALGCFSLSYAQKAASFVAEQKLLDIAYGSFTSSRMDVFLPANRTAQTPFVIIIHGGAWTLGNRAWGMRTQDSLAAHGIASANIDYRYADDSTTHYQELLKDIDSAVMYCASHATEWHTRSSNFIMNGESAGAHLALLYGYTSSNTIGAIIAFCAPADIADTSLLNYFNQDANAIRVIAKMVGAAYIPGQPLDPAFISASPAHQVKNIPTLFFHGTADLTVPYTQALKLEAALKNKGFTYKFVPMPGAGHDVGFNTLEGRTKIYGEMADWIKKYGIK
jgi:acetyl esterase/lipase